MKMRFKKVSKAKKTPYYQLVADEIVRQLEAGTAPWVQPWKAGELSLPHNPVSGARYRGANTLWLSMAGRRDPRWMTYKQAQSVDAQVKNGEKGTRIQYWKFTEKRIVKDDKGQPVLDDKGQPKAKIIYLDSPRPFSAVVFNAEQIEGLPELKKEPPEWNSHQRAESILKQSGARIEHLSGNSAFYSPSADKICLPEKAQFASADSYYATALHELGHWTGHSSRLDRDILHPFGSQAYAKEELRAEIASLMMGNELGIGHDPSQHTAYIASWIKVLKEDPSEIFRAARDAEKIMEYTLELENNKEIKITTLEQEKDKYIQVNTEFMSTTKDKTTTETAKERRYLEVPFAEKNQAKQAGAKWDRQAKSWFIPQGAEIEPLQAWLPNNASPVVVLPGDIQESFRKTCLEAGLQLDDCPVMDGQLRRVRVDGDRGSKRSGAYAGYLDGAVPAGFIQNWKTGEKITWKHEGPSLSVLQKADIREQVMKNQELRAALRTKKQLEIAKTCRHEWNQLGTVKEDHPYLQKKQIKAYGLKQNAKGQLVVPLRDTEQQIWSLQSINKYGNKMFIEGGRKQECFHMLGAMQTSKVIIIAEGYATAASIHEATGKPVAVAFDSGNLLPVTEALKQAHPDKQLVIAGDNDHHKAVNVGADKAIETAYAVGGVAVLPIFTQDEKIVGLSDFNDLVCSRGHNAVKRQIDTALQKAQISQTEPIQTKSRVQEKSVVERGR